MHGRSKWLMTGLAGILLTGCGASAGETVGETVQAATSLVWKGLTWRVTSGGMAGVAQGNPNNVTVDANGYLHLQITNAGGTWTAAELFTTTNLGFGTYQWQTDGPIDRFDKNVVLGLFPYGPAAGIGGDSTNEIDIEYSFWGNPNGVNGDWTNYPASGTTIGEMSYKFSLNGGTFSTSRFIWSKTTIQDFLINGFQPVGSTTDLINSWTYAPNNPTINIPQQALPLGMNLWCFQATPSDGKNVEVVIRDFQFVPEGSQPDAGAISGTGAAGGNGGAGGSNATGGAGGAGGGAGGKDAGGATTASGGASTGTTGATTGGATTGGGGATTAGTGTTSGTGPVSTTGAGGSTSDGPPRASAADASSGCSCTFANARGHEGRVLLMAIPVLIVGKRLRRRRLA
jgi:hypothetical protein